MEGEIAVKGKRHTSWKLIGVLVLICAVGIIAASVNQTSPSRQSENNIPQTAVDQTNSVPAVVTPPSQPSSVESQSPQTTVEPLSKAIENYSDNTAYDFSTGSGSNIDVTGTVAGLVPAQSGVTSAFGNTAIVKDGAYSAAVHQISDSDFALLAVGEQVEVKGGYMQEPSGSVVQIIKVASVKQISY